MFTGYIFQQHNGIAKVQPCAPKQSPKAKPHLTNSNFETLDIWLLSLEWICSWVVLKQYHVDILVSSGLWEGSMTGTDGEHTFMKTVLIQTITSERGKSIWTPVLPQSPPASPLLLRASMLSSYPSPSFYNNTWDNLGRAVSMRRALMKSTSLSVSEWKNNGGTEIIPLHSALGFHTFLIKVSLAA